ncbi:hypothetical protein C8Q73DRAFT_666133 [Cubamyces lactineus]|nr:hypothetical protein C8Q73DRAFT_666133 [Cubamyces lactineus]
MQTMNLFANTVAASSPATTAATLLSRLTTATYQSRRKAQAAEWDPSGDEIVEATKGSRWGAVGGERRRALRTLVHQWPPILAKKAPSPVQIPSYPWTDPKWNPAPPKRKDWKEEQFRLTEACNPFNPVNVALRAAEEAKLERQSHSIPRNEDERDELTESCNPYNPVNVAARAAAEAHLKATDRQPEPLESLSLVMSELSVCMEESAPVTGVQSQTCILSEIRSMTTTSYAKRTSPAPFGETRTPSPRHREANASPASDGHTDSTSSSWPTLASISPPQPLPQPLHSDSWADKADLATAGKREDTSRADGPDDTLGELEAPNFVDFTFLDEV